MKELVAEFPANSLFASELAKLDASPAAAIPRKVGRLTDRDMDVINGKREQSIGRVQERCGIAKAEAERQADEFLK